MKCAIFYGNGDVWEGDALDAPPIDVAVIIYADTAKTMGVGKLMMFGWDYYLLKSGGWMGVNGEVDLVDHLLHDCPRKVLKGRMYSRDVWEGILKRANAYPGFPARSASAGPFESGIANTNRAGVTHGSADH